MGREEGKERKSTYIIYMCAMYTYEYTTEQLWFIQEREKSWTKRSGTLRCPIPAARCCKTMPAAREMQSCKRLNLGLYEAGVELAHWSPGSPGFSNINWFQTGCPCRSTSKTVPEGLDLWAMWPSLGKFHDPTCQSHCSKWKCQKPFLKKLGFCFMEVW